MRLQLTMKRPVFFPDLDPKNVPSFLTATCREEALQAYCQALLEINEPCMEASESAHEIVVELRKLHFGILITKCGPDRYTLSKGDLSLTLEGQDQYQVMLGFSRKQTGIDLSDFGPKDAAAFIKAAFASYNRVSSKINHRINSLYS